MHREKFKLGHYRIFGTRESYVITFDLQNREMFRVFDLYEWRAKILRCGFPDGLLVQTLNLLTRLPNEAGEVHAGEREIFERKDLLFV